MLAARDKYGVRNQTYLSNSNGIIPLWKMIRHGEKGWFHEQEQDGRTGLRYPTCGVFAGQGSDVRAAAPNTPCRNSILLKQSRKSRPAPFVEADLPKSRPWRTWLPCGKTATERRMRHAGAKNSRTKFISFWNGAVGTMMYTDVASLRI